MDSRQEKVLSAVVWEGQECGAEREESRGWHLGGNTGRSRCGGPGWRDATLRARHDLPKGRAVALDVRVGESVHAQV